MPSVLTHYFFINDCLNEKYPFLEKEEKIALLGAQGTDPFYFYGSLFKRSDKEDIYSFATLIHTQNPLSLYVYFIKEANKKEKEEKDFIYSYIFGLLNHYILDRTTHPFVFYHSGIGESFLKNHQKYETNIDVALRLHYNNYIEPKNAMKADLDDVDLIGKIYYQYSLENDLPLEEDTFRTAYKDMYNVQKVLYSRSGFKKWLFHTFMKNSNPDNLSMPKRIEDGIDYLNNEKHLWQHPARNFKMSLSFTELMEFAQKEFNKLGNILLKAYNNQEFEKDLEKFIDETNHNGTKINEEMLYASSVYCK